VPRERIKLDSNLLNNLGIDSPDIPPSRPLDVRPVCAAVAETRRRYRDAFHQSTLLARLIPLIEVVLTVGGLLLPEAMPVAIKCPAELGDAGHRG
jgi:hypothetical protein